MNNIRYADIKQIVELHPGLILDPAGLRKRLNERGPMSLADLLKWQAHRAIEAIRMLQAQINEQVSQPQQEAAQPPKGNAMSVRMKVRCRQIQGMQGGSMITLEPVTGGSEENDKFFKATPYGRIEIGTVNEDAASRFGVGREYFVDFTPAHAVESGQAYADTQPLAGVSAKPQPDDNVDVQVPHPSSWVEGGKKDGG